MACKYYFQKFTKIFVIFARVSAKTQTSFKLFFKNREKIFTETEMSANSLAKMFCVAKTFGGLFPFPQKIWYQ